MTKAELRFHFRSIVGVVFMLTIFLFNIFYALLVLMRMRMRMRGVVLAINAFASISASDPSVEALTILFLALRFLANTALS
jgi:hypothetical protein